jgi:hypothetical protein
MSLENESDHPMEMTMTFIAARRLKVASGLLIMALLVASPLVSGSALQEHKFAAHGVASSITEEAGTKTAKFVIEVANNDEAALAAFRVVFSPDFQVAVGDIAPGQKAVSGPQTVTIEVPGPSTQSLALPVTYSYFVNGNAVERTGLLLFKKAVQ